MTLRCLTYAVIFILSGALALLGLAVLVLVIWQSPGEVGLAALWLSQVLVNAYAARTSFVRFCEHADSPVVLFP